MAALAGVAEDVPLDRLFDQRLAVLTQRVPQKARGRMTVAVEGLAWVFDADRVAEP